MCSCGIHPIPHTRNTTLLPNFHVISIQGAAAVRRKVCPAFRQGLMAIMTGLTVLTYSWRTCQNVAAILSVPGP